MNEEIVNKMVEKRVMLEFIYKKPSEEEAKKISEVIIDVKGNSKSMGNKDASKYYRKHYRKQTFQFFIGGLICVVIGLLSIFVMIFGGTNGPLSLLNRLSENLLGVLSIMMPLSGLTFIIIAIVFFIKSNFSLSSSRSKSPKVLFKMLFDDNIYFVNTRGSLSKVESNISKWKSFGYTRLCSLVPEDLRITQEQFNEYCSMLNKTVKKAEKTVKNALKANAIIAMKNGISISVNNIKELYYNIYEVNALFTISYYCFYNTPNKATAILEFNIKGVLVKNGEYWYPYDLMPELIIVS